MVKAATPHTYPNGPGEDEQIIPIVRIQKVGEIVLSPHGTGNPLTEAFSQMGKYLAEHDDSDGVALEVTLWDRTYHASIDPAPPVKEPDPRNPWLDK